MSRSRERHVMDLRSQDLSSMDLGIFRKKVMDNTSGNPPEELISFNSGSRPYNYSSLDDFEKKKEGIPDDASYFSYSMTFNDGSRCSLYLDPDRPGKVVIEGGSAWTEKVSKSIEELFPRGGERYKVHGKMGIFVIWATVIILAGVLLLLTSLLYRPDAVLISSVIFTSSVLGIYLSVVKAKEIQPANTISFVKKRNYWMVTLLHILTIALGIISAILATILVTNLL